ncbi:unnamed protein product [Pleuronectes platessa]|uniref:Uncharacterized protein n=1 Tax=Pleuronectes platessa TaxID=8262 RepID=A0A9N7V1G4_PLEPL|nr:unnamed protein product [Pleuronectes platessa]
MPAINEHRRLANRAVKSATAFELVELHTCYLGATTIRAITADIQTVVSASRGGGAPKEKELTKGGSRRQARRVEDLQRWWVGQLAAGTCEIVTLDRDSSQPRRTIARQTARCACKKGQIAGTTRARPACVDAGRSEGAADRAGSSSRDLEELSEGDCAASGIDESPAGDQFAEAEARRPNTDDRELWPYPNERGRRGQADGGRSRRWDASPRTGLEDAASELEKFILLRRPKEKAFFLCNSVLVQCQIVQLEIDSALSVPEEGRPLVGITPTTRRIWLSNEPSDPRVEVSHGPLGGAGVLAGPAHQSLGVSSTSHPHHPRPPYKSSRAHTVCVSPAVTHSQSFTSSGSVDTGLCGELGGTCRVLDGRSDEVSQSSLECPCHLVSAVIGGGAGAAGKSRKSALAHSLHSLSPLRPDTHESVWHWERRRFPF